MFPIFPRFTWQKKFFFDACHDHQEEQEKISCKIIFDKTSFKSRCIEYKVGVMGFPYALLWRYWTKEELVFA